MSTSFATYALQFFGILESSYGFRRVECSDRTVRWESSAVSIFVTYDASYTREVELCISQLTADAARSEMAYSLSEVCALAGGYGLHGRPFFEASTEERLKAALEEMARLFFQHGKKLLLNDSQAFADLRRQRTQDSTDYAKEQRLNSMREEVDRAWQAHDYKNVVAIYRQHLGDLTKTETKRYEIALKRL